MNDEIAKETKKSPDAWNPFASTSSHGLRTRAQGFSNSKRVVFFFIILIGRGGEHDVFQISAVAVFDTMSVSRSSAGKFHRL